MSIKKKFATAVATAGLLAGLFGSALVPSALATRTVASTAPVAKYTILTAGSLVHKAKTGVYGFQTMDSDAAADNDANNQVKMDFTIKSKSTTAWNAHTDQKSTLVATSSNSSIKLSWGIDDSGEEANCGARDSSKANFVASDTVTALADEYADGVYSLCFAAAKTTTAATSTITVTAAGVVVSTFTLTAVGPVASISASLTGYKYVAADNGYISDFFTIVAKDAAGTVINGPIKSVSNEEVDLTDATDQVANAMSDAAWLDDGIGYSDGIAAHGGAYNLYTLDAEACNEADAYGDFGDEGKSYALKFTANDVVSNAVTLTCTGGVDGAKIKSVAAAVTAGAKDYTDGKTPASHAFDVVATIVDADGRPMGDGGDSVDFGFDYSGSPDSGLGINVEYGSQDIVGGELIVATLNTDLSTSGKKSYTLTADHTDFGSEAAGDDAVPGKWKLSYTAASEAATYTIKATLNKAKTSVSVTADFGENASGANVTFYIQNVNSTNRSITVTADDNGVAKVSFSRRNTTVSIYATADVCCGGYVTKVITVSFK